MNKEQALLEAVSEIRRMLDAVKDMLETNRILVEEAKQEMRSEQDRENRRRLEQYQVEERSLTLMLNEGDEVLKSIEKVPDWLLATWFFFMSKKRLEIKHELGQVFVQADKMALELSQITDEMSGEAVPHGTALGSLIEGFQRTVKDMEDRITTPRARIPELLDRA